MSREPRGDSHNFGRRVEVFARRVKKPRTLLWEWLVLAADSPLRKLLAASAPAETFDFLPALEFFQSPQGDSGEVERIALEPLSCTTAVERRSLASITGRALALFSWLGVSDLHWENLVLGEDRAGKTIFAPLDVEMILADLSSPTETKLLPDADPEYAAICRHACGVRRVLPYLGKPIHPADLVAMAGAFAATLKLLDRHSGAIANMFSSLPRLREAPIRVCLRGTGDYVRARSEPLWPPLLDAEAEQLARGDIPYFFRLIGRKEIHYYGDPSLSVLKKIPLQGDVPRLDPMLQPSRGLRSPSRRKLREEGLFALLGAFDDRSFTGQHACDELEVIFKARAIIVKLASGEELESRRDLRAFVGSVYLPCGCGEVRSVFVPPVTHCEASGSPR